MKMNLKDFIQSLNWIDNLAAPVWITLTIIWILFKMIQQVGWRNENVYWQLGLLIFIWLHTIYSFYIKGYAIVEVGNIATLILTLWVFNKLSVPFKRLAKWLIPQIIWITIASLYIALKLFNNVKYTSAFV